MNHSIWILAGAACLLTVAATYWHFAAGRKKPLALPRDWALIARPVFNNNERRAYRLLRDALPHYVVLSKLPLVRFCQPEDTRETLYWYDLLGPIHVGFAICNANGRVLAAIDLDLDRGTSLRIAKIKQSVLAACRIQYLRCAADQLPSLEKLHQLVPQQAGTAPLTPPPQSLPVPARLTQARDSLATAVASRRAQRKHFWQNTNAAQDSFFTPDSRFDSLRGVKFSDEEPTEDAVRPTSPSGKPLAQYRDDIAGIVVDDPPKSQYGLRGT
jgi:Protein of unknown function (DUF2726)